METQDVNSAVALMTKNDMYRANDIDLLVASRRTRLLYLFSTIGIVTCIVFGFYNLALGQSIAAWFEFGAIAVAILNVSLLRYSRNVGLSSSVMLIIMLVLLCSLLFTGGVNQAGILWFYTFPILAFFLQGSRKGFMWVGGLYAVSIAAYLFDLSSPNVTLAFSYPLLQQLWLSLLVVSLLIYFYQNINEEDQGVIRERTGALKKAKDETVEILDNMLEGAQLIDSKWRYIYLNDAAVRHGRQSRDQLLGHTMWEVYPEIETTPMFARLKLCMETRTPQDMENEFVYPDGSKAWFDLKMEPVPQGVFLLSVDITERKKTGLQQAELAAIVDSSDDAIIGKTLQGIVTSWNGGAQKMYGYTAQEIVGKSISLLVPKGRPNEIPEILARVAKGESIEHYQTLRQTKDGRILQVSLTVSPIKNSQGQIIGASAIARDITEAKKNDEKMIRLQKDLELENAKEEFVSLASHQLRTPLSAIQGYADLLLEGDAGAVNEKQKHYLEEVYHANKRMLDLINALLNASRIDMGVFEINPEPTDVAQIAETQLQDLAMKIKEREQAIVKTIAPDLGLLNFDPKLTAIIFQNLLSNAVKYTPPHGTITLAIEKIEPDLRITVRDTGMGIPEAQQSRIFSKLFRADNARVADPDGTGLGLYIVKSIAEESGGKIWFETKENAGSAFFITIPLAGMKKREGTKGLT